MVQTKKKIALLHRHTKDRIKETNAAYPYLLEKGIDVLTFKTFDRAGKWKFFKDLLWMFYAPFLVFGKGYDVIYCDDSIPFYSAFVKLASPRSKVVLRIGDFHLMYYYSGLAYKILHFFEVLTWKMADRILAISNPMAGYIICEAQRWVDTVLDPVDPKDFPLSNKGGQGYVMFHGLLIKNKNVDILLQAAERMPETEFVIVGDGPDRKRLESLAPDNVHFMGWRPFREIPEYISYCASGVALRSDNPGNEYVVTSPYLQYGVMGKPCLVTRRKVFGDYLWQFSGIDELVIKLKSLLYMPGFAASEGEKLRDTILKYHDAEKIAGRIWSLLSA